MEHRHFVAVLMGSENDLPSIEPAFEIFQELGIRFEANIMSAHRTPDETSAYVKNADHRGAAVFIAAAGMAAHLAGAVAAHTVKPVIGIPLVSGDSGLRGLDALLSTVQMPPGVPVAMVAMGAAGAKNAAFLSAQILAIENERLREKLIALRADKVLELQNQNKKLTELINKQKA